MLFYIEPNDEIDINNYKSILESAEVFFGLAYWTKYSTWDFKEFPYLKIGESRKCIVGTKKYPASATKITPQRLKFLLSMGVTAKNYESMFSDLASENPQDELMSFKEDLL